MCDRSEKGEVIHEKDAKLALNSQTKGEKEFSQKAEKTLIEQMASTAERLAKLEARLAELEERVNGLAGAVPGYFYGEPVTGKKKPGVTEKIGNEELFRRRDGLISWLEEVWPQIARPLLAAKKFPRGDIAAASGRPPKRNTDSLADSLPRPSSRAARFLAQQKVLPDAVQNHGPRCPHSLA